MELEDVREYCLSKPFVTEAFPFDEDTLVFKVKGKMFLLTNLERFPTTMNLKCDPERAIELREQYDGVQPVWHMNKKHWNTVDLQGDYGADGLLGWVGMSYDLVVHKLKKADREEVLAASRSHA